MGSLILTFIGYAIILFIIADRAKKHTHGRSDFFLAGRALNGPLTALGAGASDMSSWLLMVLPGLTYVSGLHNIWMPLALAIGAYTNWKVVAKRLRIYTEIANDSLTLPSYLHNRFNLVDSDNRSLKTVAGLAMLIFFTIYSASGFVAGAALLQLIFHLNYLTSLLIIAAVIITYTAIGGFFAVSWIDFFQGCLMFFSLLIVPIVTCFHLGGLSAAYHSILQLNPGHMSLFSNISWLGIISLIGWGFGYFGQPHINCRFMAIRSIKELPIATKICMSWMIMSLIGAIATGLFGFVYFQNQALAQPETVFIALSNQLFPPILAGILLSAILSAVMSTVSAQILMSSSIFTEDFYYGLIRKASAKKEHLWVSRASLIVLSAVALLIAALSSQNLFGSIGFAWSGLGAALGPVTVVSLFWRNMSRQGAVAGMIVGMLIVILWQLLSTLGVGGIFNHPDILPGFVILPGIAFSLISIVVFSKLYPPIEPSIFETFDRVQQQIKLEEQAIAENP